MSSTHVLIPVEEYLNTVYRPDCDYIDGEVRERNMGETPHSGLQTFFGWYFRNHLDQWRVNAFTEQRVQIAERNYRIADVCLVSLDAPYELVLRTPPVLCIEILSSKDSLRSVQERVDDYARMGVPCSWVVDPWKRKTYLADRDGCLHAATKRLTVPSTPIFITNDAIFGELDRLARRTTTPLP